MTFKQYEDWHRRLRNGGFECGFCAADGALSRIPLRLDPSEQRDLERSASIIHGAIESLKL
jgi:hypothetical protein